MADERADFLLVEDNPDDVVLTLRAFKTANLANTVHVARDGVKALEYLFGAALDRDQRIPETPKLILLDLKLPRLDGHEVLKRIKNDPRTTGIPVIVLTSSSEERDIMRSYEIGADSYIVKPIDFEQFTDAVREVGRYWLVVDPREGGGLRSDLGGKFPTTRLARDHGVCVAPGVTFAGPFARPPVQLTGAAAAPTGDPPTTLPASEGAESLVRPALERKAPEVGQASGFGASRLQLTDAERSYGAALNSPAQAVIALSLDGTITGWNPGAEKLYGFSAAEAVGRSIAIIVPEDRPDEIRELMVRLRRNESLGAFDTRRRRKDGSLVDVTVHVFPVTDQAGTLIGIGSITRDVTKLRLAEEMFRLAVEACPSGMLMTDRSGAILMLNTGIERLFGYSRDELIGQSVDILVPTKLRTQHEHWRAEYALRPKTRQMGAGSDLFGRRKDRTEFAVEVTLNPVNGRDGTLVLSVVTDISARKRAESLKDEFVSTVSHELRTPLTSISASLGMLVGNRAGKLPDAVLRLLTIAYKNSQRLVRLVNDILDIEKMESGQVVFVMRRLDVRPLVEQAIEASRPHAESLGVTIRMDPSSASAEVRADPDRLVQVVTNLLSNAVKFSPSGTEVTVSIAAAAKTARIAVRDHGPGIPANFRERIYEKFAQADATDTRQKGGTGLGLSIVKGIVSRLEGATGFSDAPGGGTIFYVELPVWQNLVDTAPATADELNVT